MTFQDANIIKSLLILKKNPTGGWGAGSAGLSTHHLEINFISALGWLVEHWGNTETQQRKLARFILSTYTTMQQWNTVCDGEGWRVDSHWSYNAEDALGHRAGGLESSNGINMLWGRKHRCCCIIRHFLTVSVFWSHLTSLQSTRPASEEALIIDVRLQLLPGQIKPKSKCLG